ncbi:MAG: hypothetical protein V3W44_08990 [Dehalococcoidales bacterium]
MGQNFTNGVVNTGDEAHRPPNSLARAGGTRFSPDSVTLKKDLGRIEFNKTAPSSGVSSLLALSLSRISNQLIMLQNALFWRQDVDMPGSFDELFDQKQFPSDADVQLSRSFSGTSMAAVRFTNTWLIADGSGRPIQVFTNKRGIELGLTPPSSGLSLSTAGTGLGGDGGSTGDKPTFESAWPVFGYMSDQRTNAGGGDPFVEELPITTSGQFNVEAIDDIVSATTKEPDNTTSITLVADIVVNQQGALRGLPFVTGGHNLAALFVRMDKADVRTVATDGPFYLDFLWTGDAPADTNEGQDFFQQGWNMNFHYTTQAKMFDNPDWPFANYFERGTGVNGVSASPGQFSYGTAYWFPTIRSPWEPPEHFYNTTASQGPPVPGAFWQFLELNPLRNPQIGTHAFLDLDDTVEIADLAFMIQIGVGATSGGARGTLRIFNVELTNGIPSDNQGTDPGQVPNTDGVNRFTTANAGLRYGYTEIREFNFTPPGGDEENVIPVRLESNLSPVTPGSNLPAFSFASQTGVKVVRPPLTNLTATHWRLYRSTDAALNEETLDFSKWAFLSTLVVAQDTYFDGFDRTGHPMDLITPEFLPPFLLIGGAQIPANSPPPNTTDVTGSFAQHALYASDAEEGLWRWSRRGNPHAVPEKYNALVDGVVTAFADLGSVLVFTDEEVKAYPSLAVAADSTFLPGRNARIVSPGRGNLSRRGVVVFSMPGREPMAVFTAVDGLWLTNATQATPFSRMIDWPTTLDTKQLGSTELIHDVGERRLVLTFLKEGKRFALYFYYDRPDGIKVLGPSRLPLDGGTHTTSDGQSLLFTASNGVVYQEKVGVQDFATLEPGSGRDRRVVVSLKSQRIYPFGRRVHGVMKEFGMFTTDGLPGETVDVNVTSRRDGQPAVPQVVTFDLTEPGWKWRTIDRDMESFVVELETFVQDFPGLVEWDWVLEDGKAPRGDDK